MAKPSNNCPRGNSSRPGTGFHCVFSPLPLTPTAGDTTRLQDTGGFPSAAHHLRGRPELRRRALSIFTLFRGRNWFNHIMTVKNFVLVGGKWAP